MSAGEKMLHVVYRVGDLKRTGDFLGALGMHQLRARDVPEGKYTNEFFGYGSESMGKHFSLELTYNYGVDTYDIGDGVQAFEVASDDPVATTGRLEAAGFKPTPALDGTYIYIYVYYTYLC